MWEGWSEEFDSPIEVADDDADGCGSLSEGLPLEIVDKVTEMNDKASAVTGDYGNGSIAKRKKKRKNGGMVGSAVGSATLATALATTTLATTPWSDWSEDSEDGEEIQQKRRDLIDTLEKNITPGSEYGRSEVLGKSNRKLWMKEKLGALKFSLLKSKMDGTGKAGGSGTAVGNQGPNQEAQKATREAQNLKLEEARIRKKCAAKCGRTGRWGKWKSGIVGKKDGEVESLERTSGKGEGESSVSREGKVEGNAGKSEEESETSHSSDSIDYDAEITAGRRQEEEWKAARAAQRAAQKKRNNMRQPGQHRRIVNNTSSNTRYNERHHEMLEKLRRKVWRENAGNVGRRGAGNGGDVGVVSSSDGEFDEEQFLGIRKPSSKENLSKEARYGLTLVTPAIIIFVQIKFRYKISLSFEEGLYVIIRILL
jgi:hypothetical protein